MRCKMLQVYSVSHFHIKHIQDVVWVIAAIDGATLDIHLCHIGVKLSVRTQQATGGYCNCTTQTNQFTHNEKNTGTYTRKMILFHVSVTCQSKQMSCSLSHTPTVLWLYSCFCPYSKWAIPVRRPQSAAQSPWKCVSGEIPRCQKSCQWERIHWSLPLSDLCFVQPHHSAPPRWAILSHS